MTMRETKTLFLVDDDTKLRRLLVKFFEDNGFTTQDFSSGEGVVEAVLAETPAAVILDIMMPGETGLQVLDRLRKESSVPVLMLTAKGDEEDRITGLELGADDYLPKPFNPRELLARINAVLRRAATDQGQAEIHAERQVTAGAFVLNSSRRTVSAGGKEQELSQTEYKLLEALMTRPGMVLTRDELLNFARGKDFGPFDRSIDMHISKLRSKTEALGGGKRCIKTVWGAGYMFEVE